jgi:hypothetical protein
VIPGFRAPEESRGHAGGNEILRLFDPSTGEHPRLETFGWVTEQNLVPPSP